MSERVELFTTRTCPYSAEAREDLEWRGVDYVEYDVESDPAAREHLLQLTGGSAAVPVIVEDGHTVRVGWMGRSCAV